MRTMHISRSARRGLGALLGLFYAAVVAAQTQPGDATTTTTTTTTWYTQWWAWAVGVAVFLIIVIALTNRGSRST